MNEGGNGFRLEDNRLLARLPAEVRAAVRPHLEPVTYHLRERLFDADEPIRHAVFVPREQDLHGHSRSRPAVSGGRSSAGAAVATRR